MDEDEDFYVAPLGCIECGTTFTIEDLFGGACPVCQSSEIITFEDALTHIRAHREFLESMGIEEEY